MQRFLRDTRGQLTITIALLVPMLVAALGLAVDYTAATGQARKLQGVADIAALTAAREMQLANTDASQITTVANNVAQAQYTVVGGSPRDPLSVQAQVIGDGNSVEVVVEQQRAAYFMQSLIGSLGPVSARAVARVMGGGNVCVIGLDPDFHGRGLGGPMTLAGLEWLASQGLTLANLYVESDNHPANATYERLGFERHATNRAYTSDPTAVTR